MKTKARTHTKGKRSTVRGQFTGAIILVIVLSIVAVIVHILFNSLPASTKHDTSAKKTQTEFASIEVNTEPSCGYDVRNSAASNTSREIEIEKTSKDFDYEVAANAIPITDIWTDNAQNIATKLEDIYTMPWSNRIGKLYKLSKCDYVQLCNLVAREYGAYWVPEEEKAKVVQTVMNRVESEYFPNTVEEVLSQPGQYTGELSRGYYDPRVDDSIKKAVLYYLNGWYVNNNYLFYWGDGKVNHFYTNYEDFKVSYDNYFG